MATAAVATFNPLHVPGLGKPLCEADMNVTHCMYNNLPNIEDQVQLQPKYAGHIKALLNIIGHHSMGHLFCILSAHCHGAIPNGMVCLEADIGTNGFTWNRATATKDPKDSKMHATFFKINEKGIVPFKFAKGPSPVAGNHIPSKFLSEFTKYLIDNSLTSLMALKIGNFANDQAKTAKLEIQWGNIECFTIAMPVSVLAGAVAELVPTGFNFKPSGPGRMPHALPDGKPNPGTHWAKVVQPKDTHKVYVNATKPVTPEVLKMKLIDMGYIIKF